MEKEVEVRIGFDTKKMTKEQLGKLFEVQKLLSEIGVTFDTGFDCGSKERDWEWDWSLKGPVKVFFVRFVDENPDNRYARETRKKETQNGDSESMCACGN